MVEIKNRNDLKAWLKGKPREVAQIVAVRVSLRVLPFVHRAYSGGYTQSDELALASFHANAIAWPAIAGYNQKDARAAAYANATAAAANAAANAADANAAAAAYAAANAAVAANAAANAASAYAAAYAAAAYANAAYANAANAAFWTEVEKDVGRFESELTGESFSRSVERLGRYPIFSKSSKVNARVMAEWGKLKTALPSHFKPWIDWYEDRLKGARQNSTFERALLSISEKEWALDPAEVNALLAERMEQYSGDMPEYSTEPSQSGLQFSDNGLSPIDFSDTPIDADTVERPAFGAELEELQNEIRRLIEACDGRNEPVCDRLKSRLLGLDDILSNEEEHFLQEAAQTKLAIRIGRFDKLLDNEENATEDPENDAPLLPKNLFDDSQNLKLELFTFSQDLTQVKSYQHRKARAKDEEAVAADFERLPAIIGDSPDVVASSVGEVLDELVEASKEDIETEKLLKATSDNLFQAIGNRISAAFKKARELGGDFASKVGQTAAARMIVDNWQSIQTIVGGKLAKFLTWIVELVMGGG